MGTRKYQNKTIFNRCPKDEDYPFNRVPAKLYQLNGYQFAIMAQIISNKDGWNLVQKEIRKRVKFPRNKFNEAWKSLVELGFIKMIQIQGAWNYTINEDPEFTITNGGKSENLTYTTGAHCEDGTLTTTNINYYTGVTATVGNDHKEEFQELWELYPLEVTRSNGNTYKARIRRKECEQLYSEYLDSGKMTHDEIKTALIVELNEKKNTGKMMFLQNIYNWIKDRSFEQYKGKCLEPVYMGYGTELW